ncbi:MAG TPA: hypothetical protein VFO11_04835 [Candidatus Polarisedimenticolaceae bacterium]|nr:hypothetical protein [Candidatus Polarisedimenticolaceae bacterium]
MRFAVALFTLILLAPSPSLGAVKFAWPSPVTADVKLEIEGERGDVTWKASTSYKLTVESSGDVIRITRGEAVPWTGKGTGAPVDRMIDLVPTIRVSRSGEFLGIEGAEVAAARAKKVLAKEMPEAAIATLTSEAGLTAMQKDFWLMLVEGWTAFDPEEGEVVELTNTITVPQLGGGRLDLLLEVRRSAPKACDASDSSNRCVEFLLASRPDKTQVEKILAGVDIPLRAYDIQQEVHVLTDPTTLLPYRVVFSRSMKAAEKAAGSLPISEEATRTYTFRWTVAEPAR